MRAANVSGSVSTPTPASATVSPALSENAELVAQLDSRIAALKKQMQKE